MAVISSTASFPDRALRVAIAGGKSPTVAGDNPFLAETNCAQALIGIFLLLLKEKKKKRKKIDSIEFCQVKEEEQENHLRFEPAKLDLCELVLEKWIGDNYSDIIRRHFSLLLDREIGDEKTLT